MRKKQFPLKNPIRLTRFYLTGFKLCALLFFVSGLEVLHAQQSFNATGSNASGSGGSVSYSVGQVACQIQTAAIGSVTEGVQQPYEISVVTNIEEPEYIELSVLAYPNPTIDNLTLSINKFNFDDASYQLYDMNGKLLKDEKISGRRKSIIMSNLVPATYFIKVFQGHDEIKTFKIIKN